MRKSKYLVGERDAGLATFSASNDGDSRSRDLRGAVYDGSNDPVFRCAVTSETGTADLDITIQDSEDGVNFDNTGLTFTQITAAGSYSKTLGGQRLRRFVRVNTVIGGGGSYATAKIWVEYTESRASGAPAGNPTES